MAQRFELAKNYTISRVINGCWQLSEGHNLKGATDYDNIMNAFNSLANEGFTTFDCADIYTGVEEFLGKFLSQLKGAISPADIQIHTKFVPDIDKLAEVDFKYTEKIIDRSLKRLKVDTLDLVQFHWWDYDVPGCLEVAGYLSKLKDKGKIRNIAATNFDTEHLAELVDAGISIVSIQVQYSILDRRPEKGLLQYCRSKNIALFCYGTLSGGFLAESWIGKEKPVPETRSQVKYLQIIEETLGWDGYQKLLKLLERIAKQYDADIAHIAAKYILSQPGVGAAIIGVDSSKYVESNKKLFLFELTDLDITEIREFLDQYKILDGDTFTLERTVGSKFREIMKMNLNEDEPRR